MTRTQLVAAALLTVAAAFLCRCSRPLFNDSTAPWAQFRTRLD